MASVPEETRTLADLFVLACATERAAAHFYEGLAHLFRDHPEISAFWTMMMKDEFAHERQLTEIKGGLSADRLRKPAERDLVEQLEKEVSRFMPKFDLAAIETLDDAYEVAYELEYSEVNSVYKAIVNKYVSAGDRLTFVLAQNLEHVSRLETFSKSVADETRRFSILPHH